MTHVYDEVQVAECHKTWDMLKFIKASSLLSWLCIEDFNEVLLRLEHVGVQERSSAQIAGFREMADVCGLSDVGYVGRSWTYYEKKVADNSLLCRVRLDQAMMCAKWMAQCSLATLSHRTAAASDHSPIVLRWDQTQPSQQVRRRKKSFRYEMTWETHDSFIEALRLLVFLNSITKNRITSTNSNNVRNDMIIINLSLLQ
jgi:hypothetical protein